MYEYLQTQVAALQELKIGEKAVLNMSFLNNLVGINLRTTGQLNKRDVLQLIEILTEVSQVLPDVCPFAHLSKHEMEPEDYYA